MSSQYPRVLLLFLDCARQSGEPHRVPALGVHALSAYLRERGGAATSLQLQSPVPCSRLQEILEAIGADDERIAAFEGGPKRFLDRWLAAHAGEKTRQQLQRLLDLWVALVAKEGADIVGLTLYRANLALALLLAARIKESLPGRQVVFGGPEVCERTIGALLRFPFADALVKGEGEEALFQLVRGWAEGRAVAAPGIYLRGVRAALPSGDAAPLEMERLPPPDFDRLTIAPDAMLPVEFNRGCVANCRFCEETRFWKSYRQMSVERAVDNLRMLQKRYGRSRFFLSQSLMNGDMVWLEAFARALIEARLGLTWGGNARIHPRMDDRFLRLLREAGCRFLHFGIESGSQTILKQMKKGVRVGSIADVLTAADDVGLWNHTYWIFGYPGETAEDLLATAAFITEHRHRIHSHLYHEYGEPDAIGNRHPHIYAYLGAMQRQFTRYGVFYADHRGFIRGLFRMEAALLSQPALAMKALQGDGEAARRYRQRGALLRGFTMGFLRRYIERPEERSALRQGLTRECFAARFAELERNAASPGIQGFPDALFEPPEPTGCDRVP